MFPARCKDEHDALGLVTDIHNHAAELARALELFRKRGVDQVVTIGDTLDAFAGGDGAAETAALLHACNAIGVWGNHDFTLCREVPDRVRERCPQVVLDVMARMQPRLVIGDCHFSHKESSVDPHDVAQLWDLSERRLNLMERADLAFAAVVCQLQFVGHYHRWWAATPAGPLTWVGERPLQFEKGIRYFVVVAAVCDGSCGILDSDKLELMPLSCGGT